VSQHNLYNRPDRPGWYLRLRRNGKTIIRFAGSDKRTAEGFRARLHVAIEQEELLGQKAIPAVTLAEIEKPFFAHIDARHAASNAAIEKQRFGVLVEMLGHTALRNIDRGAVEDLLTRLRVEKGIKPATANRYASLLSSVFKFAVDRDLCRENPAKGVRREREELRPVPFISDADVRRLIVETRHPEMGAFVRVLSDTGLRRSEALALRWRDVDLRRGVLTVRKSKTRVPREVPLTAACAAALRDQAARQAVIPLHGRGPVWGHLAAIRPDAATRRFKTIAKRAGLPDLRLHDLRHGFACRLRETGAPIQVIAQLCGHKSLTTTLRYSRHMATDSLRNAIVALQGGPPDNPLRSGHPAGYCPPGATTSGHS
jgi:integrase